jgi:hypothetical protein
MGTAAKKLETNPPIRTSKDGRQYVKISDVLKSVAARAEIRRQAETQTSKSATNGNSNGQGSIKSKPETP